MRSKLFVPASRPDLFAKALLTAADAICFDLEDAVAAKSKNEARENLNEFFASSHSITPKQLLIRVNAVHSPDFLPDLLSAVRSNVYAIALPKVDAPQDVEFACETLSRVEADRKLDAPLSVLVTIESPRGLRRAHELATVSPRICGLQLGFADLLEPLGISSDNNDARQQIRLIMRLAAADAGVDCFEAAYPHFRDEAGFIAQLNAARAMGYAGASCIHPGQVEIANKVFTPTAQELAYAELVVAAADEAAVKGIAVVEVEGKMIDLPFVQRARAILSRRP
jgi:citrate lyase beta subunit